MAQYARPDSDVSAGSWTPSTGATLYGVIDESSASDADYMELSGSPLDFTADIGLSSVTDPASSSGHTIRWREYAEGIAAAETLAVYLYQGASLIATLRTGSVTRLAWTDRSYTLSGAEADSITDYTDLRIRFTGSFTALGTDLLRVSWAEMEVPDAPPFKKRYFGVF